MAAIGAPDPRQVDGLGGADSLLSKVCIVAPSSAPTADIECEFANVTPGKGHPTYGTNCGNLLAGAALFAIDEGLARIATGRRAVRILNRNTGDMISARISQTESESVNLFSQTGMADTGTHVLLDFHDPTRSAQEQLLPTGNVMDEIQLPCGSRVMTSVIDAGAMYVFVNAEDLGLVGTESKEDMDTMPHKLRDLEYIRGVAAMRVGLVESAFDAAIVTPDVPKLAFVSSVSAQTIDGRALIIDATQCDLNSRIISSQKFHNAYAVTAAIATASAASISGSVVQKAIGKDLDVGMQTIKIGHPTGVMACTVNIVNADSGRTISHARLTRTARRIMEGTIFIPCLSPSKEQVGVC
jgi:2-methylaconitate cis-trans-isomerase PrpF